MTWTSHTSCQRKLRGRYRRFKQDFSRALSLSGNSRPSSRHARPGALLCFAFLPIHRCVLKNSPARTGEECKLNLQSTREGESTLLPCAAPDRAGETYSHCAHSSTPPPSLPPEPGSLATERALRTPHHMGNVLERER